MEEWTSLKKQILSIFIIGLLILSACGNNNTATDGVLVEVNGNPITQADVNDTIKEFYGDEPLPAEAEAELHAGIVQYLVQKEIFEAEAKRLNITEEEITEEYHAQLREFGLDSEENLETELDSYATFMITQQLVLTRLAEITEEDIEAKFAEEKESLEEVTVRHILISNDENDNPLEKATEIYNEIKATENFTEEDFAALVEEHSNDPGSIATGGEYSFTRNDPFVVEFKETAFNQQVGEISEPVETEFGYHIIYTTAKSEATLENFISTITMMLLNEKAPQIIEDIMNETNINVVDPKYKDLF